MRAASSRYRVVKNRLALRVIKGTPYEGGKNWPKIVMTQRKEGDVDAAAGQAIIQMLKENLGMNIEHEVGEIGRASCRERV